MADINSFYTPQASVTQTGGLPGMQGGQGGGMPDFAGLMRYRMALDRQRAIDEARLRQIQIQAAQRSLQQPQQRGGVMQPQPEEERPFETPNERNARSRAQQAQLRILEAQSRPMPTKLITGGPGIIPGYAPDTTQLPVALLPHNAQMLPSEQGPDTFRQHQAQDALRAAAAQRQNAYYGR